jgi:hypothetical protein
MGDGRIRVLFVHGLKDAKKGEKQAMLEQHFHVLAPPLNIRLHTNWATSPLLREALGVIAGYMLVVLTVLLLMHYEMWWADWRHISGGLLFIFLVTVVFLRLAADQYHEIVLEVVESAINTVEAANSSFKPDVIVGEDFGGAVVAWMLNRGLWSRGTLLLSPTQYQVASHAGIKPESIALPSDVPVVIVQGSQDQVVKMVDTEKYAATGSPELVQLVWQPFTADGHKLESMGADKLAEFVRTAFLMKELQEKYEVEAGKELVFVESTDREEKSKRGVRRRKGPKGGATRGGKGGEKDGEDAALQAASNRPKMPNPTVTSQTQVAPRASARLDDDDDDEGDDEDDEDDDGDDDDGDDDDGDGDDDGDDDGDGDDDDDGDDDGDGDGDGLGEQSRNRMSPPRLRPQQGM